MGGPPEQAGGAEPGGTALPDSQRAPGKVPHGLGRAGSPGRGGGSCPRPSMWEGEGHTQTETALARSPAPPLPLPAVSPLPLICFHLSLPRTHLPAPFTGIPSAPHSPQSRLCFPTSSLAPKTPPGVFSIFPKWSIKPPFISLPVHWGCPRALLVSYGSGGCGAVDIGALWTLLCMSYHPGVGESRGVGTRIPSRLTLLSELLCGASRPTHCCSRTDVGARRGWV